MIDLAFFKTSEYREAIQIAFTGGTKKAPTYAEAARFTNVQPTYFSNVLKGRADFSDDQIYSICEFLRLNDLESAYLKTCHQWARSGHPARKKALHAELLALRKKALSPGTRFQAEDVSAQRSEEEAAYFLDPMHHVLALCLDLVPELAQLPEVRTALALSPERTDALLGRLTRTGRLQIEKSRFKKQPFNYHLGADSQLLFPHQAALRQMSLERMRQLKRDDFKAFSATFSAPLALRPAIEEIFTRALEEVRDLTQKSKAKDDTVFQVNLDLFPWFTKR